MIISFFGSLLETEELKRLVFGLWLRHTSLIVRNKRGFRRRFTHEFHVKNEPRQKQVWSLVSGSEIPHESWSKA